MNPFPTMDYCVHSLKSRFAGEKILIADDEVVIVELATLLLRKRGFIVLNAYDGQDCLDQVAEHNPALVLLDYMMPVMNGLDALKQIRRQGGGSVCSRAAP